MRDFSQSLLGFTTVFLFLKPLMFSVWFYLFGDFYFGFIPTLSIYLRPVYWLFTDLLLITSNVGDLTLLAFDHKHNFWLFLCIFPFLFYIAQWDLQRFNMAHKTAFNHEFRLTLRCWEEHHNRQAEEKNPAADREGRPHLHADRVPAVNCFLFFLLLCAGFAKVWG